jgi:hypothetical protein
MLPRELSEAIISESRPDQPVRGGRLAGMRDVGQFRVPIPAIKPLGPETSWRYFSPARADVQHAPAAFLAQLHEVDPRLDAVWHPVNERWVVWFRDRAGWKVVFPVQYAGSGRYMPLDERTIAKVWDRSGRRWGGGLRYWERIEGEIIRTIKAREAARQQEARDAAGDRFDFAQIKVAMRGKSNGSKFATHHSE